MTSHAREPGRSRPSAAVLSAPIVDSSTDPPPVEEPVPPPPTPLPPSRRPHGAAPVSLPHSVHPRHPPQATLEQRWRATHAVRTRARLALFVESTTVPALRESVGARRGELRAWGREILAALGADDPETAAQIVVDYVDGVILHRLTSEDDATDPQTGIGRILDAVLQRTAVM